MHTVVLLFKVDSPEEAERKANVFLDNPNIQVTEITKTEPNGNSWSITIKYLETPVR